MLLIWLGTCAWLLSQRWGGIHWFALADTDDNLRMAQVRALLAGQDWFDLRQYKLDPPRGFNVHWSRLVDLPIAGLILLARPFVGGKVAEQVAVAVAPMLPLAIVMISAALAARRLIAPYAYLSAAVLILFCNAALNMFMPLRIDHHGWQLAFLTVTIAGLADPERVRGGFTVGIASALSLVIGLELLPFIAVAGGTIALRWVGHREAAPRMLAYACALAATAIVGYVLFASYANRAPVCDALSPVWLTTLMIGASSLALLAFVPAESWLVRAALVVAAGAATLGFFWLEFPQCHGRPEGVSPELYRLWLANVREAKPVYTQDWQAILRYLILPVAGLIGAGWRLWRARGSEALYPWLSIAIMALFAVAMLFWQIRAGPAAQLIGVVGATALAWPLVLRFWRSDKSLTRVLGAAGAFMLLPAAIVAVAALLPPAPRKGAAWEKIARANRTCPTLPALAPIARMPPATVMTFVDLGPRLITVTPHKAIAGPYHRNEGPILDIHHAFDGPPEQARAIARRHGATLLLICPHMNEGTVYRSRSPRGFYARLEKGERFDWLEPVRLPDKSPFLLFRIS